MLFSAKTADGNTITYKDQKRYLWVFSILSPSIPSIAAIMLLSGGNVFWAAMPLVFYYGFIPIFDSIAGEDFTNPPEEVVEAMMDDPYYRTLLFISIPVFLISFLLTAVVIGTMELPLWAFLMLTVGAAIASGSGLTVGHELGHKTDRASRLGAKIVTSFIGYSHFCIEHNKGHHVMVSTPEDPTSARFNENLYAFALRELPATAVIGWRIERERLAKKGHSFWSFKNDLLQGYAFGAAIAIILIALFGWIMLPFLLLHHGFSWFQLTMANYVEHYGLLRKRKESGRYEPCEPHHSWNTNHIVSNLLLFHLQRHSDHHANPMRPYQSLRNFDELPRLPSGYPGCFVMALLPPIWFSVMNPKVIEWADGDMDNVNTGKIIYG